MSNKERSSPIWTYFKTDSKNMSIAKCLLCPESDDKTNEIPRNTGTSNLWSHLRSKHKQEYNKLNKCKIVTFPF